MSRGNPNNTVLLYTFLWVIIRCLNFVGQCFRKHSVFRNVGLQNSDAGELPRRKRTTFRTQQKFEIKNTDLFLWKPERTRISSNHSISQWWYLCLFNRVLLLVNGRKLSYITLHTNSMVVFNWDKSFQHKVYKWGNRLKLLLVYTTDMQFTHF
jgi:hypothetical protein